MKPKDLFSRDAVRFLVDDLALNRSKDPSMNFRPPKMSIADKLHFTKKKMEESNALSANSSAHSSQVFSMNFGSNNESHTSLPQGVSRLLPEKQSPISSSLGGFQASTSVLAAPPITSAVFALKQAQASQVQNVAPHPPKLYGHSHSALPRADVSHSRLDQRPNSSTFVTHTRDGIPEKALTTPGQPLPGSFMLVTQPNKMPNNPPVNSDSLYETSANWASHQEVSTQESKNQVIHAQVPNILVGNQPIGQTYVLPSPFFPNHVEIGKNVQRVLHKNYDYSNWAPPSIEFMCKTLHCQICKVVINDAESVLVCDSCEKGTHLKCLQSQNRDFTKLEWHCQKCLNASHGKPLPPKYGRVTRSAVPSKISSSSGATQVSTDKKPESSGRKSDPQIPMGSSNSPLPSTDSPTNENQVSGTKTRAECDRHDYVLAIPSAMKTGTVSVETIKPKTVTEVTSGPQIEISDQNNESSRLSPCDMHKSILESCESINEPLESSNLQFEEKTELPDGTDDAVNEQNEAYKSTTETSNMPSQSREEANANEVYEASARHVGDDSMATENSTLENNVETTTCNSSSSFPKDSQNVEWVGDIVESVEDKTYYQAFSVGGILYKLQSHVLVLFNSNKLVPSKLQALWEDNKTGSKWAVVSKYHFPSDLSATIVRPSPPENGEVYASKNKVAIMAGQIRGTCEVLGMVNFREAVGRRSQEGEANISMHPIFFCRWAYDDSCGVFESLASMSSLTN